MTLRAFVTPVTQLTVPNPPQTTISRSKAAKVQLQSPMPPALMQLGETNLQVIPYRLPTGHDIRHQPRAFGYSKLLHLGVGQFGDEADDVEEEGEDEFLQRFELGVLWRGFAV